MAHSAAPDPAQAASATSAGIRDTGFRRGPQLSDEWTRRLDALTDQVVAGEAPWRSNDALRRAALHDAAGATGLAGLPAGVLDDLALAGHRLRPWPDSAQALRALAGGFTVVALSNAGLAQLADMSAVGDLAWHCVLSAELARAYEPDPAACRLALDLLGLTPRQTMMVAAHPRDLRAAAEHGMRSAYISRPGEGVPAAGDRFDVHSKNLANLAELRTAGAG